MPDVPTMAKPDVAEKARKAASCGLCPQPLTESCGSNSESGDANDLEQLGRFLRYDFVVDEAFTNGWQRISRTISKSMIVEKYLDAKLFYYGTVVEQIAEDVRGMWRSMLLGRVKGAGSLAGSACGTVNRDVCPSFPASDGSGNSCVANSFYTDVSATSASTSPADLTPAYLSSVACSDSTSLVHSCTIPSGGSLSLSDKEAIAPNNPAAPYPSSFTEIVRLISAGLELPGLERPSVVATNTPPTPPTMQRPPKPWEQRDLSTC